MERELDLNEVSDGKLYTAADMVKIGCNDCEGCSECCRVVDDTILLDAYDIYQLERKLEIGFEELLEKHMELSVVDSIVQPHLRVKGGKEGCTFLSEEGRCRIHDARPGFCRMFPMGRIYEEDGFRYFYQVHECPYPNKTKVKLKKWFGIPELPKYEQYIKDWHAVLCRLKDQIRGTENDEVIRKLNLFFLNSFYVKPYDTAQDFYEQFYQRREQFLIL